MVIKTYSEERGKKAFDWNKALSKKRISKETWKELQKKASDWVTCACGNQCAIIPRWYNGAPLDDVLTELGSVHGFYGAVQGRDKEEALHFLEMIEMRSAFLIKKLSE